MVSLGFLPYDDRSRACGVSDDGSTVVGWSQCTYVHYPHNKDPFLWTADTGLVGLGRLPGYFSSMAYAVSADGSVIVGCANFSGSSRASPEGEAFRWTADSGFVGLGYFSDDSSFSYSSAVSVSADGSIVVGNCWRPHSNISEAFLWTAGEGMVSLGRLPDEGFICSFALDVSDGGSAVVGCTGPMFNYLAFLWTSDEGMVDLKDKLEGYYGLDLTGWKLTAACGISSDGLTIVGNGINPDGFEEGWIATIPEPPIEADIDIDPDTLNLKSKGKWITCYIWLPEEYDVADVNSYSVFLKFGEVEIEAEWIWFDEEEQVVMAKFNRLYVQEMLVDLGELGEVELTVTGELIDGTKFEGTDTIRVIDKGRTENRKAKS